MAAPAPNQVSSQPELPKTIGNFPIHRLLGEGGFGQVFLGYDQRLERWVALKVPHPQILASEKARERFNREAKATARLRHPHIVPIYAAGYDGKYYYIAAQFIAGPQEATKDQVSGQTLEDLMKSRRLGISEGVRIVRDLAEALAYAHEQGIIHRDVKPGNVLLDEKEDVHLSDFGLAQQQDSLEKITQEGAILGTPAYMAPEMAKGQQGTAHPACDQYSLGIVLYEVLCGEVPFKGMVPLVLSCHVNKAPIPPRKFRPEIPRDLETICLKAVSKNPNDRYPDCQAMANDLRRWMENEPILARRLRPHERLWRWSRKNPVLSIAIVLATLLGVMAGVSALRLQVQKQALVRSLKKESAAREAEAKARQQVSASQLLTEASNYHLLLSSAEREWNQNQLTWAETLLDGCPPSQRKWEWHYLKRICQAFNRTLRISDEHLQPLHFSPDGRYLLSMVRPPLTRQSRYWSADSRLVIWDLMLGSKVNEMPFTYPGQGRFIREGRYVVGFVTTLSPNVGFENVQGPIDLESTTLKVWEVSTGKLLHTYELGQTFLRMSSDWENFAARDQNDVLIRDVLTEKKEVRLKGSKPIQHLVHLGNENDAIVLLRDQTVTVWSNGKWRSLLALPEAGRRLYQCSASADGRLLAGISMANINSLELTVWDVVRDREVLYLPGLPSEPSIVTPFFDPVGEHLLLQRSSGYSKSPQWDLSVWKLANGRRMLHREGTRSAPQAEFSPKRARLWLHNSESMIEVWDLDSGLRENVLRFDSIGSMTFNSRGQQFATQAKDGAIKIWTGFGSSNRGVTTAVQGAEEARVLFDELRGIEPSDDVWAVSTEADRSVVVRDSRTGKIIFVTPPQLDRISGSPQVSKDGRHLSVVTSRITRGRGQPVTADRKLTVWGVERGEIIFETQYQPGGISRTWFSKDGRRLIVNAYQVSPDTPEGIRTGHTVILFDLEAKRKLLELQAQGSASPGSWLSPDEQHLLLSNRQHDFATANSEVGTVKAYDVITGKLVFTCKGHTAPVTHLTYSRRGDRFITSSLDTTLRIWTAGGKHLLTFAGHSGQLRSIVIHPTENRLASLDLDSEIRIWDLDRGQRLITLKGQSTGYGFRQALSFSADGHRLLHLSEKGVTVWDGSPFQGSKKFP